jgi:hypothetical protein
MWQKTQARHRENVKLTSTPKISPVWPPYIRWQVITPDITGGWNEALSGENTSPYVYVGLSARDYLCFTAWLHEVVLYLKSQKVVQKAR